ncbi:MAG TPA: alanine racemase [Candidatus Limnocylindrales bacterium]|nr:alanine racemase [Candidatus Limnocylindrales bacterium]
MPTTSPTSPHPLVGLAKADLDTPVMVLDLDRFDANARRLSSAIAAGGKDWRPHSKGHKSPWIARRQMELGAIGVTCAKPSEAAVMVDGGITSILIANELATRQKVELIAGLESRAEIMICADDPFHVRLASEVATSAGVQIPMVVDINIGMDRTGVAPGPPALELARAIDRAPGLRLAGIMGYEGHVLTAWPNEEKRAGTERAIGGLVESRRLIEADGMPVGIVSGGGSGNYMYASSIDGLTELQAGGGCLMDPFYGKLCHLEELGFEYALTILTTVTSRPTPERVITDAGFKALSAREEGQAIVLGMPDVELVYLSAEHGVWRRGANTPDVAIGDRLEIIPDYHDTTTFRHDAFVGLRGGVVEQVIPLLARGRLT